MEPTTLWKDSHILRDQCCWYLLVLIGSITFGLQSWLQQACMWRYCACWCHCAGSMRQMASPGCCDHCGQVSLCAVAMSFVYCMYVCMYVCMYLCMYVFNSPGYAKGMTTSTLWARRRRVKWWALTLVARCCHTHTHRHTHAQTHTFFPQNLLLWDWLAFPVRKRLLSLCPCSHWSTVHLKPPLVDIHQQIGGIVCACSPMVYGRVLGEWRTVAHLFRWKRDRMTQ